VGVLIANNEMKIIDEAGNGMDAFVCIENKILAITSLFRTWS
jgi:hypothetical protein